MSLRMVGKLLRCFGAAAFLWFAMPTVSWAQTFGTPVGAGSCAPCATGCQTHHCPPAYKYCYEGAPHIHWHRGCPHPICDPCTLQNFGYYDTCWSPWPFLPNWGNCITPPPAASVHLNPFIGQQQQRAPAMLPQPGTTYSPPISSYGPPEELPLPRRADLPR